MNTHPQSRMTLEELGTRVPPYAPTYDFPAPFIDRAHAEIAELPRLDGSNLIQMTSGGWLRRIIPGWLLREDALKLYELAFFARGDVLELGTYNGLSTAILARAARNSPYRKHVETVERKPARTRAARRNLDRLGLLPLVTARSADATVAVREHAENGRQFGFVFVDHSHAYAPVLDVCKVLDRVVAPGGFCLFHDFNDIRNRDPEDDDYAVFQAVEDGLDKQRFEFYGIYGCTALYRLAH
jgi:predicted O-methyltransferase YrrM